MKRRTSLFYVSSLRRGLALLERKQFQGQVRTRLVLNAHRLMVKSSSETPFSWLLSKKQQIAHFSRFSGSSIPASSLRQRIAHFSSIGRNSIADPSLQSNTEGNNEDDAEGDRLEVMILSKEKIRPASPTPDHLRTYEISIFDIMSPHNYIHLVYFYQNDSPNLISSDNLVSQRRQLLKQSLSETLTRFYPFAGKVEGECHIDCNDDGVYYVEERFNNCSLSEFLKEPDNKSVHQLFPFHPCSDELSSQMYVVMIQVTTFSCGGIAIGLSTSHRIVDGYSHMTFLNAWAGTTRGGRIIHPDFTSPSIFLPNLPQPLDAGMALMPFFSNKNKCVMKRFVFPGSSTLALKMVAGGSSRIMSVAAFIWKRKMAISRTRSDNIPRKTYNIMVPVNFRNRSKPPLPDYSIGNLCWLVATQCCLNKDQDVELSYLAELLKNATDMVNEDYIEKMKGKEGNLKVGQSLKEMSKFHSDENSEYMVVSSMCNGGMYEADFGWGNPVWASVGNADADIPSLRNVVCLMDSSSENGIEAWVSLTEREMAIFEKDPELLAFASPNPCPIHNQTV